MPPKKKKESPIKKTSTTPIKKSIVKGKGKGKSTSLKPFVKKAKKIGKGVLAQQLLELEKKRLLYQKMTMEQLQYTENELMEVDPFDDNIDLIHEAMEHKTGRSATGPAYGGNSDEYDYTYQGKQLRFNFKKGLREKLIKAQIKGGKLICAHCNKEIKLQNGKEVWTSKSGKQHATAPPIDHHNPAWSQRLKKLESRNLSILKMKEEGTKAYNAMPLRILHMTCNSSIGDRH